MNPKPDLAPMLRKLRMDGVLQSLEARNRQAIESRMSYMDFLSLLVSDEVARREQLQFDSRLRRAAFRSGKTIEQFDFDFNPTINTALVHDRRVDGATAVFGNQGALYQGAMTWFDHETGSIWSQPLGKALVGPRYGATVKLMPSQLTTWGEWVRAHPETAVLTVAHPSPPFQGQRPGPGHVVGVIVGDVAAAWPYQWLAAGNVVNSTIGETPVSIWLDASSGAIRAADLSRPGREPQSEIPVIIAWRSAWLKFYPDSVTEPRAIDTNAKSSVGG